MKVKCITVYPKTIEIEYYNEQLITIYFDFVKNTFKAFIERAYSTTMFQIKEKQEYLSIIDECLNAVELRHTKIKLNITKADFTSGSRNIISENPECYIKPEDMFNWITVQKMKGVI